MSDILAGSFSFDLSCVLQCLIVCCRVQLWFRNPVFKKDYDLELYHVHIVSLPVPDLAVVDYYSKVLLVGSVAAFLVRPLGIYVASPGVLYGTDGRNDLGGSPAYKLLSTNLL